MTTMETSVSLADDTVALILAAKERFRRQNQHRHWSEEQLELEWTRYLLSSTGAGLGSGTTGTGYTPEAPRTMPSWTGWSLGPSADTASVRNQPCEMNRDQGLSTQSAPVMAPTMSRNPSSRSMSKRSYTTFAGNPTAASIARWQTEPNAPFNGCNMNAEGGHTRKRPRPLPAVVEYHPYDYIKAHSDPDFAIPPPRPTVNNPPALAQQDPTHLSPSVATASSTFMDRPLLDSPVPSTPLSDLTDATTISSTQMSRDLSSVSAFSLCSSSLPRAMNEMHIASTFSPELSFPDFDFKAPLTQENLTAASLQYSNQLQSTKSCVTNAAAVQSCPIGFSSAQSATVSSDSTLSTLHTAQPMKREDSSSSAQSSSSRSNQSRSARRHFEQIQNGKKTHILPKVDVAQQESAHQMKRTVSADGSTVKEAVQIPRKQFVHKQQRDKLYCPYCEDHPEGFRGEHELQRHTNRAHAQRRKVWICEDLKGQNPGFLSNCKQCREGKRYGAYYNAAAHLRRTHFNPRKRGRKAKSDAEKRGGKGGGNWPPMEALKESWMREIEEVVSDMTPQEDDDLGTEDQVVDADTNHSSDDDNEPQQFDEPTAVSLDQAFTWSNEFPVEASAAVSATTDILSFDFSAADGSFDVTSTLNEQQLDMLDNNFNTVSPADMMMYNYEDAFSQQAPVFQEMTAWAQ